MPLLGRIICCVYVYGGPTENPFWQAERDSLVNWSQLWHSQQKNEMSKNGMFRAFWSFPSYATRAFSALNTHRIYSSVPTLILRCNFPHRSFFSPFCAAKTISVVLSIYLHRHIFKYSLNQHFHNGFEWKHFSVTVAFAARFMLVLIRCVEIYISHIIMLSSHCDFPLTFCEFGKCQDPFWLAFILAGAWLLEASAMVRRCVVCVWRNYTRKR